LSAGCGSGELGCELCGVRELDTWKPGAHSGTFRGNQLAFAAGVKAIEMYRRDDIAGNVVARGAQLVAGLARLHGNPGVAQIRGRGLMWGVELTPHRGRAFGHRSGRTATGACIAARSDRGAGWT
jgi:4-aminobutyrate aminotransferase-like enzyme